MLWWYQSYFIILHFFFFILFVCFLRSLRRSLWSCLLSLLFGGTAFYCLLNSLQALYFGTIFALFTFTLFTWFSVFFSFFKVILLLLIRSTRTLAADFLIMINILWISRSQLLPISGLFFDFFSIRLHFLLVFDFSIDMIEE